MKRWGYKSRNGWKWRLSALLAVCIFMFMKITALGVELTPWMISGDGDFVIWYVSPECEMWIADIYAASHSGALDRITFVQYYSIDEYLTDLEAVLPYPEDPLYPDLIFLEPDYTGGVMGAESLLSAKDLGITETDMGNMFPYTIEIGTDALGEVRAFFGTAAPGAYQVRADLAAKYLGTRDPLELYERYFSDWKKMMAAARRVYKESGGMVALIPGYGELYGGLAMPEQDFSWMDENGIPADAAQIARMMRLSWGFERYSLGAQQWTVEWMDAMNGDGINTPAAIAYAGSPWFTPYCLTESWLNNTIIVEGPADFYWGGNGMAATAGCSDVSFAADIIRTLCCDGETMTEMAKDGYFVNNREALAAGSVLGYGNCSYLYHQGQDLFQAYQPLAENLSSSRLTAYDWEIRDMYLYSLQQYFALDYLSSTVNPSPEDRIAESMELGEDIRDALEEMVSSQTSH